MKEELNLLSLVDLCDRLVVSTEKLMKAMAKKADANTLGQLKVEVKDIQAAIREKGKNK